MYDQANRDIHCLRLSLTESCNLRCCYCRPQVPAALPPQELTDAELLHLVQLFAACGIDTLRLTGGEPLLRVGVPQLTARLKAVPGIRKVTLTTNGTLLSAQLPALKEAGLDGINLSLNSLSYTRNKRISRLTPQQHAAVKQAFEDAMFCGIPLKLNYMALRGYNEQDYRWLVRRYVRFFPVRLRFLELMPVGCAGNCRNWASPTARSYSSCGRIIPGCTACPGAERRFWGRAGGILHKPRLGGQCGLYQPGARQRAFLHPLQPGAAVGLRFPAALSGQRGRRRAGRNAARRRIGCAAAGSHPGGCPQQAPAASLPPVGLP